MTSAQVVKTSVINNNIIFRATITQTITQDDLLFIMPEAYHLIQGDMLLIMLYIMF